jgi:hypothetical protein
MRSPVPRQPYRKPAGASQQLALSKDREGLRIIVENLGDDRRWSAQPAAGRAADCVEEEINDLQVSLGPPAPRPDGFAHATRQSKYFDTALEGYRGATERRAVPDADRRRSFQGLQRQLAILRAATIAADHIRKEVMSKELMKRLTGSTSDM